MPKKKKADNPGKILRNIRGLINKQISTIRSVPRDFNLVQERFRAKHRKLTTVETREMNEDFAELRRLYEKSLTNLRECDSSLYAYESRIQEVYEKYGT